MDIRVDTQRHVRRLLFLLDAAAGGSCADKYRWWCDEICMHVVRVIYGFMTDNHLARREGCMLHLTAFISPLSLNHHDHAGA